MNSLKSKFPNQVEQITNLWFWTFLELPFLINITIPWHAPNISQK